MILNCNSCGKKFVVPDSAITASGRLVQCGSCGNKWKQFPANKTEQNKTILNNKKTPSKTRSNQQKQKTKKVKKSVLRKSREINLYSPEYLAKKHGIKLSEDIKTTSKSIKVSLNTN